MNREPSLPPKPDPSLVSKRVRPVRSPKTAVTVAQRIVEEITRSNLQPGTRLANEQEMLSRYEVGRGTLRESLRYLEMTGVITLKPGPRGGPIVAEPDAGDLARTLSLFLQLHLTSFGSIVEVRRVLEPAIARMAAERQDAELLEEVRLSVELMGASTDDEHTFLLQNERFHEGVAWASGNQVFALLMTSLHWISDASLLGVGYPLPRRRAVLKSHRQIYAAIASGSVEAAGSAMAEHVEQFNDYLERFYPAVLDAPLRWSEIVQAGA